MAAPSPARPAICRPGMSTQQTGAIVADLDRDGVNDSSLSFRPEAAALVWYRRMTNGWFSACDRRSFSPSRRAGRLTTSMRWGLGHRLRRRLAEQRTLVVGKSVSELQSECFLEAPHHQERRRDSASRPDVRRFQGPWQGATGLLEPGREGDLLAEIPVDPRNASPGPAPRFFPARPRRRGQYAKAGRRSTIDGGWQSGFAAGNYWFKHAGGSNFKPVKVADMGGRIAAGKLKPGKYAQNFVIARGTHRAVEVV